MPLIYTALVLMSHMIGHMTRASLWLNALLLVNPVFSSSVFTCS